MDKKFSRIVSWTDEDNVGFITDDGVIVDADGKIWVTNKED